MRISRSGYEQKIVANLPDSSRSQMELVILLIWVIRLVDFIKTEYVNKYG